MGTNKIEAVVERREACMRAAQTGAHSSPNARACTEVLARLHAHARLSAHARAHAHQGEEYTRAREKTVRAHFARTFRAHTSRARAHFARAWARAYVQAHTRAHTQYVVVLIPVYALTYVGTDTQTASQKHLGMNKARETRSLGDFRPICMGKHR
eukprot:2993724-Pleurochrysis_carterae.AAC.3